MMEAVEPTGWEISQESFAPPDTRRVIRGWERALVPAHAPRLNGQKVWKRICVLPGSAENDGTEAQDELEREGAGQRKKARPMGTKENITNAVWLAMKPGVEAIFTVQPNNSMPPTPTVLADITNIQETPRKSLILLKSDGGVASPELHFIPRKRTNSNHVITPKKYLRQTTLNKQAQRQSLLEPLNDSHGQRPRKSLRKSIRISNVGIVTEESLIVPTSHIFSFEETTPEEEIIPSQKDGKSYDAAGNIITRRGVRRSTRGTSARVTRLEPIAKASNNTESSEQDDKPNPLESSTNEVPDLKAGAVSTGTTYETEASTTGLIRVPNCGELLNLDSESIDSSLSFLDPTLDDFVVSSPNSPFDKAGISQKEEQDLEAELVPADGVICSEVASAQPHLPLADTERSSGNVVNQARGIIIAAAEESKKPPTVFISPEAAQELPQRSGKAITELAEEASQASTSINNLQQTIDEAPIEKSGSNNAGHTSSALATTSTYDHDDTDMLRNFLTRVKANKAAKSNSPKRKRSLPHSPLRIPLGEIGNNLSPLSLHQEGDLDLTAPSPLHRKNRGSPLAMTMEDEVEEAKSCRRSARTRLPVKSGLLPLAPSLIPMRRLGQEDTTVTLKRNEEKELAALTRVNTRKNKAGSIPAVEVLAKKIEDKDDHTLRQRLLKEVFDSKIERGKEKKGKGKGVTWAEQLVRFQTQTKGKLESVQDNKEKEQFVQAGEEKKQGAVKIGVRSKIALGMAANGTPAPKRKARGKM